MASTPRGKKPGTSRAKRPTKSSTSSKSRPAASRASTSASSRTSSQSRSRTSASKPRASQTTSAAPPTKEALIEQITKHLRRLKRDDLESINERLEDKSLQLSSLAYSGEGGFGFQDEENGESSGGSGGVGQKAQELMGQGAEQGRALIEKARQKISS